MTNSMRSSFFDFDPRNNDPVVADKDLDLVVWGATGFTGALAVAYLLGDPHGQIRSFKCASPAAPPDLRWAVAGRNRAKLEALGAPEVIVSAADDELPDIEAWVRRARVVAGFAGPFVKYSDRVVEACARHAAGRADTAPHSFQWKHDAGASPTMRPQQVPAPGTDTQRLHIPTAGPGPPALQEENNPQAEDPRSSERHPSPDRQIPGYQR